MSAQTRESSALAVTRAERTRLADRVAALLADGHAATVPDIARVVRARDLDVRQLVTGGARFERRPAPPGRNGHGRFYGTAAGVVPRAGTSPDSREGGAAVADTSAAAKAAEALWLRGDGPRSVGEAIIAANRPVEYIEAVACWRRPEGGTA